MCGFADETWLKRELGEEKLEHVDWIMLILLGALLGALGQVIRSVMGAYKAISRQKVANKEGAGISGQRLLYSVLGGACAGALAAISLDLVSSGASTGQLTSEAIGAMLAAGYAGTDFVEGFIRSRIPAT